MCAVLRQLWDQGCQNGTKLLEQIRKLGYIGSYSALLRFLQPWREEKRAAKRMELAATQRTQAFIPRYRRYGTFRRKRLQSR